MIKLNNKNITYVALADSANSLKAPKEIWYADSNNSVKLVYRRKDALIEGEDYEKYHWLKGDGLSLINTLKLIKSDSEVRCTIIPTSDDFTKWQYIYGNNPSDNEMTFMCVLLSNDNLHFRHKRGYVSYTTNTEYEFSHSIDSVEVNDEVLPSVSESDFQESNTPFCLFNASSYQSTSGLLFDGYIRYLILSEELNLIPCKLLKPVPKWLDANGIRRQVGECGMIDLVSGKFYGNVNSVGTFTVENYYERKEWLVGDGSAYIDTGHNVNEDLDWETKVVCPDTTTGTHFFWYRPADDSSTTMIARTNNSTYVGLRIANNSNQVYWQDTSNQTVVKCESNTILINDVSYTVTKSYGLSQEFYLFNIKLEDGAPTPSTSNGVKCSYFRFLDSNRDYIQNLIPCTLTMDLPASMDANNIARVKGTSGMWDLVSDRFYGNVANSGTFKAVNLAEGVDYEVHQWLVGDGNTTIKVIGNIYRDTFSLVTVPTTTTANKRLLTSMSTSHDGNKSEYQIMIGDDNEFSIRHGIRINNNPTSILTEFRDVYINDKYEITTYRDGDYYYGNINGVEYKNNRNFGEYQFADEDIVINIYANGFKLGNFNSGRFNLTPVRLLRSIPSKYDANGIARQAGECGMYDTVNDVFYGNVASSGTFSVSDDS